MAGPVDGPERTFAHACTVFCAFDAVAPSIFQLNQLTIALFQPDISEK